MSPSPHDDPEVIDVRPDEQVDLTRLEPWLRAHLDGEGANAPLTVRQFGGGHANLTYLIRLGEREYVLRRPPLGPVAPTSHDMKREHRVLARLHEAFRLAPQSLVVCDDPSILGVDFHVMERRHGFVIRGDLPDRFRGRPELNRRLSEMIVDTLADLHRVDPASVGLGELGRPDGFAQRQLDGWISRWQAAKDKDHSGVERIIAWLQDDVPVPTAATLLHNDFKLDNILVDTADPATPVALLDWDMATRGDPLMELGYLLNFWTERGDDPGWTVAAGMPTYHAGCLTRQQVVTRYADRTGFNVARVRWYHVFGILKLLVIIQQIYIRFLRGQTHDGRFARFGARVKGLTVKGVASIDAGGGLS